MIQTDKFDTTCTILVVSCDAYRDIERPFLTLFRRFWPDCPYELVVNGETGAEAGFDRAILSGKGKTWSSMLAEALDAIATPYVILLMNDYYLSGCVNTKRIQKLVQYAILQNALNLRMNPNPAPKGNDVRDTVDGIKISAFPKNCAYAISCQAGIWKRDFLHTLATRTKSAWEFERYGSFMFDEKDTRPLLVTNEKVFPFLDVIHKGYWEQHGIDLLKREAIAYDYTVRGLPPWTIRIKEALKKVIFNLHPEYVTRIQNIFNAGKK